MEAFIIAGTDDTPSITLDKDNNKFIFSGKSLPEDVEEFYTPVLFWIEKYAEDTNEKTLVKFRMDYFNTASSKMILDILERFEIIASNGKEIEIEWHYWDMDEDMQEAGEGYEDLIDIPFKFVEYKK